MNPEDAARLEQIRAKLYSFVSSPPEGADFTKWGSSPDVTRARGILARMPKSAPGDSRMPAPPQDEVELLPGDQPASDAVTGRPALAPRPAMQGSIPDAFKSVVGGAATMAGNAVNAGTGGGYRFLRDQSGALVRNIASGDPKRILFGNPDEAPTQLAQDEAKFNADHPILGAIGAAPGYIYGAVPRIIGRGVAAGVGGLARATGLVTPQAAGPIAGSAAPILNGLTAAGTAGATSLAERTVGGESPRTAISAAGKDALLGGAIGTVGSLLTSAARGVNAKLRDPKTEIGRTITTLEKNAPYTETQEFQDLPHGAPGSNAIANKAAKSLVEQMRGELAAERAHYGQEQERILAKHAGENHLIVDAHETLNQLEAENSRNGVQKDTALGPAIEEVRKVLTTDTGAPDTAAMGENRFNARNAAREAIETRDALPRIKGRVNRYIGGLNATDADRAARAAHDISNEPVTIHAPAVPLDNVIFAKRLTQARAEYGMPATPENRPYRLLDQVMARETEAIDPDMAALNERYAAKMKKLEAANEIILGEKANEARGSRAQIRRATAAMGRLGDSTQAATTGQNSEFADLKALDPKYAEQIGKVETKKEWERSRFGLPHVSRRIEHLGSGFILQNGSAIATQGIDPALQAIGLNAAPGTGVARGIRTAEDAPPENIIAKASATQRKRNKHNAQILSGSAP